MNGVSPLSFRIPTVIDIKLFYNDLLRREHISYFNKIYECTYHRYLSKNIIIWYFERYKYLPYDYTNLVILFHKGIQITSVLPILLWNKYPIYTFLLWMTLLKFCEAPWNVLWVFVLFVRNQNSRNEIVILLSDP